MADFGRSITGTSTGTRSRSRPSRPSSPDMHRIISTHYLDDQSVYDQKNGEGVILKGAEGSLRKTETQKPEEDAESLSDPENISEKDIEKEEVVEEVETPIQEVRAGIRDERDVELGSAQLEKKQSTGSARDPNLVR
jgi:hypothetical protein